MSGPAPSADELKAIEQAAREYWDAWFDGDAARIARCLHPRLAKRHVVQPERADSAIEEERWQDVLDGAARGDGTKYRDLPFRVTVLSATPTIAAVRVEAEPFVDLLHLGRFGDGWRIVNILWEECDQGR